jgi:hypothetical protein
MNIRPVHETANSPDPIYQKRPVEWFIGRCVKIAFESDEGRVEWMWVHVQAVDSRHLIGTLDNDPLLCTHIKHGDSVSLSRLQIAAVDLSEDEWWEEVARLRAEGDYFNRYLGSPSRGSGFGHFYEESFTPRQALNRWVKWQPSEDEPLHFLTALADKRKS